MYISKGALIDKKNNIFITGPIHIGKSTIIKKVIERSRFKKIKGFRTVPIFDNYKKSGFYLESITKDIKECFAHIGMHSNDKFDVYKFDSQIFDELGVKLIEDALKSSDCIIMDEIGMMESKSIKFKNALIKALDSSILILGVFQLRAQWFRDILQERTDTKIFTICARNREYIIDQIISLI